MSGGEGNVNQRYFLDEFHAEIRKVLPTEGENFAALVLISSPSLFPAIYWNQAGGFNEKSILPES
jgi:hypothetical protein